MPFSDTLNRAVFQFLAGNFHQDIESPEDALQELLTEESKEYLEEAIIFLKDFINSVTPINWLFHAIDQLEEAATTH